MKSSQTAFERPAGHPSPKHPQPTEPTLSEWARRRLAPHLDVVSASVPEPVVRPGDVIGVFLSVDEARRVVKGWERIEPADQSVGFVALGLAPERDYRSVGADPEGVGRTAGIRAMVGAMVGAVGGAVAGLAVGLVAGWGAAAMAAVLAGALFGAVAGAMFVYTRGSAWGEAYRHSFVDPDTTVLAVCSISCSVPDHLERAVSAAGDAKLLLVGADGEITPLESDDPFPGVESHGKS